MLLTGVLHCLDDGEGEIRENADIANSHLRGAAVSLGYDLPVEAIVDAILDAMQDGSGTGPQRSPAVLLKCLSWAQLLFKQCSRRVLRPEVRDRLLEAALAVLTHPDDMVAVAALRLISHLVTPAASDMSPGSIAEVTPGQDLFARTCHRIFRLVAKELMGKESIALSSRGELVVRKLCEGVPGREQVDSLCSGADVFVMAAQAVANEEDDKDARHLVRILNRVLLTSQETRSLRAQMQADAIARQQAASDESVLEVPTYLLELLTAWFHCPVSTLALCLWLHLFDLAADITARLVDMEWTPELRTQLHEFVELLESPIFMGIRLQLLDTPRRPALLRTVVGLLALLPQESSLQGRLEVVMTGLYLSRVHSQPKVEVPASSNTVWALEKFNKIIALHESCASVP